MWYLKACRSCLTTTGNFIRIGPQARKLFKAITELQVEEDDGFPQYFCAECYVLIKKVMWFRRRSRRAHFVLKEIEAVKKQVGQGDLQVVNRSKTNLISPYSYCNPKNAATYSYTTADAIDSIEDQKYTPDIEAALKQSLDTNSMQNFDIDCNAETKTIKIEFKQPNITPIEKPVFYELIKNDVDTVKYSSIIVNIKPANWRELEREEEEKRKRERDAEIEAALREIHDGDGFDDGVADDFVTEDIDMEDVFKGLKEESEVENESEPDLTWPEILTEPPQKEEKKEKNVYKRKKKDPIPKNRYNFILLNQSTKSVLEDIFTEAKIRFINEKEQKRQHANRLLVEPFKSATYKCAICIVSFKTVEEVQEHCEYHNKKLELDFKYPCKVCLDCFSTEIEQKQHSGLFHWYQYDCPRCDTKHYSFAEIVACFQTKDRAKPILFKLEYQFEIHAKSLEDMYKAPEKWSGNCLMPHRCETCKIYFETSRRLRLHMEKHGPRSKLNRLECDMCSLKFRNRKQLKRHIEIWHLYNYTCRGCKKTLVNYAQAKSHEQESKGCGCFVCSICGEKTDSRGKYMRHVTFAHKGECSICGYMAADHIKLNLHQIRKHGYIRLSTEPTLYDRKYRCEDCQLYFLDEKVLFMHLARAGHDAAKNYESGCIPCFTLFDSTEELAVHKQTCVNSYPRQCSLCPTVLATYNAFKVHHKMEHRSQTSTEKPEENRLCPFCGIMVKYVHSHINAKHKGLTKLGDHKVQCKFCSSELHNTTQYVCHVLFNHTAKPYCCTLCGTRFIHRTACRDHILKAHAPVRPYTCEACRRNFSHLDYLHDHCMKIHNVDLKKQDKSFFLPKRMFGKVYSYLHMKIDGSLIDLNILENTPVLVCDYMDENEKQVDYTEVFFFDPTVDPSQPNRNMPKKKIRNRIAQKLQDEKRKLRKKMAKLVEMDKKNYSDLNKAIVNIIENTDLGKEFKKVFKNELASRDYLQVTGLVKVENKTKIDSAVVKREKKTKTHKSVSKKKKKKLKCKDQDTDQIKEIAADINVYSDAFIRKMSLKNEFDNIADNAISDANEDDKDFKGEDMISHEFINPNPNSTISDENATENTNYVMYTNSADDSEYSIVKNEVKEEKEETEEVLGQLIEKDGEYFVLVDGLLYTVDKGCLENLKAQ